MFWRGSVIDVCDILEGWSVIDDVGLLWKGNMIDVCDILERWNVIVVCYILVLVLKNIMNIN